MTHTNNLQIKKAELCLNYIHTSKKSLRTIVRNHIDRNAHIKQDGIKQKISKKF